MLLFHCILTLMNDLLQRENQVFKSDLLICTATLGDGERLGWPILSPSPSKLFWSFYLFFSLSDYVILLLYLKTYE